MGVQSAIRKAEAILPGQAAPEGKRDPRWQAVIAVGQNLESDSHAVWKFAKKWGCYPDEDLNTAIATCLLEHLLEIKFDRYIRLVERLAVRNDAFAFTFYMCYKFGQSEEPRNSRRFDRLQKKTQKRAYRYMLSASPTKER